MDPATTALTATPAQLQRATAPAQHTLVEHPECMSNVVLMGLALNRNVHEGRYTARAQKRV